MTLMQRRYTRLTALWKIYGMDLIIQVTWWWQRQFLQHFPLQEKGLNWNIAQKSWRITSIWSNTSLHIKCHCLWSHVPHIHQLVAHSLLNKEHCNWGVLRFLYECDRVCLCVFWIVPLPFSCCLLVGPACTPCPAAQIHPLKQTR